jgi:hypothetical protein
MKKLMRWLAGPLMWVLSGLGGGGYMVPPPWTFRSRWRNPE